MAWACQWWGKSCSMPRPLWKEGTCAGYGRETEGRDVERLAGGDEGRGEGGRVNDGFGLARSVEPGVFDGDGAGKDGGEESGVEVDDGFGTLVEGPGESGARGEVGIAGGRGLERVAEAAGEGEAAAELDCVFSVGGELPLRNGDKRYAGGDGVGGCVPPGRLRSARRYCSRPLMVVVAPVGLLLASRTGAAPPAKVNAPLKVLGSVSWTKMPRDCAPIFQVCFLCV